MRQILHIDLDAFFCSVEELYQPHLKGKAFAVGGSPEGRGVVAACSYGARRYGIDSAMPMAQALRLCPNLIIVSHRFGAYQEISGQVFEYLETLTPYLEIVSIDEGYMDATDMNRVGSELARDIRDKINQQFRIPCSIGVASSKLVAKIANSVGKRATQGNMAPNSIFEVPTGEEEQFLGPLPIEALIGVGPKTGERLRQIGIYQISQALEKSQEELHRLLGKNGEWLYRASRGIDSRPVSPDDTFKSLSKETTFETDVSDEHELLGVLLRLSEQAGKRLRSRSVSCLTISIKLRLPDFTTYTRQCSLSEPIDLDKEIYTHAKTLFERLWKPGMAVRLLGVGVSHFFEEGYQLSLFGRGSRDMQMAIDEIREKFGDSAVGWAASDRFE